MNKNCSTNQVKKVYDSGIFDQMVGTSKEKGDPPLILKKFFAGDIAFIKNKLSKDKINLEVGCGFGRLLFHLAAVSKEAVGIDFSKVEIRKAKLATKYLPNVKIKLMRAEKMNFKNNTFDQTLCLDNSLGNMPGIEKQVIQEMKRVTQKGGKIIVRVFADNDDVRKVQYENYKRLRFTGISDFGQAVITDEGFYSRRFTRKNLKEIFNSCGLEPKIKKDGVVGYIAEAVK